MYWSLRAPWRGVAAADPGDHADAAATAPFSASWWNGSMTATASGSSSAAAVLNLVKPRGDHLVLVAPRLVVVGEPGLEHLFEAALDHAQQFRWPVPSRMRAGSTHACQQRSPCPGLNGAEPSGRHGSDWACMLVIGPSSVRPSGRWSSRGLSPCLPCLLRGTAALAAQLFGLDPVSLECSLLSPGFHVGFSLFGCHDCLGPDRPYVRQVIRDVRDQQPVVLLFLAHER